MRITVIILCILFATSINAQREGSDQMMIDIVTNNAESAMYTVGVLGGFSKLDGTTLNYGLEAAFHRKGIYANAKGYRISTTDKDIIPDDAESQYGFSAIVGIPVLKGTKAGMPMLFLGNKGGAHVYATSDDFQTEYYRSLGVDLGIDYYQNYASDDIGDVLLNDYFAKSTSVRGGLFWSMFGETSFRVENSSFSTKERSNIMLFRFYVHAILNRSHEITVINRSFFYEDPVLNDDMGFVAGIDFKIANKFKNLGLTSVIEGGKYPIAGSTSWGVQVRFGLSFMALNR